MQMISRGFYLDASVRFLWGEFGTKTDLSEAKAASERSVLGKGKVLPRVGAWLVGKGVR